MILKSKNPSLLRELRLKQARKGDGDIYSIRYNELTRNKEQKDLI